MTESADGMLWLVSGSRLLTFDGLRMAPFGAPAGQPDLPLDIPTALMTAKDGTVWVGYTTGEVAHVGVTHIDVFGHADGLPNTDIESIFEDSAGNVHAETESGGIFVLHGRDWVLRQGVVPGTRFSIDSSDTLWGAAPGMISWLPKGGRHQEMATPGWSADVLHEAPDHSMWALTRKRAAQPGAAAGGECALRRLDVPGHPSSPLVVPVPCGPVGRQNMWLDADGSVWVASFSGALHVRKAIATQADGGQGGWTVESFTTREGLTSDTLYLVLRDTFGNVWFAGKDGLDRFTPATLHKFDSIPEHQLKLAAGPAGRIWIAGWHTPLRLVGKGEDMVYAPERQWSTLYGARDGTLWASTSNPSGFGFARPGSKHFEEIPFPKAGAFTAQAISEDADGILVSHEGLWRYGHGIWTAIDQGDLRDNEPVAMLSDHTGRVWLGYADGPLASLQVNAFRRWGGDVGIVEVFLDSSRGVFAGGAKGIAFFDGARFRTLRTDDPLAIRNVSGLVEAPNGDFWANGEEGVALLPAGEIAHALSDPSHVIQVQSFTGGDLSGGRSPYVRPSAVADGAGRLWFSISRYIAYLDLGQKAPLRPESKVSIRSVEADSVLLRTGEAVPAGTHTLSIGYVGVNLAAPEQVRYRYRLSGEEKAWREAGRGTEAIYTGLKNGTYHFEVMASNGAGTWTTLATPLTLEVLPLFYQTLWFRLLCLLAAVACLVLLVQLRVRAAEAQVRAHLSGRYGERLRISRELHDTLLQGVQGLVMKFFALARQVDGQPALSEKMELALVQAEDLLVEGRNRVQDLRSDGTDDTELMARLRILTHGVLADTGVAGRFEGSGRSRPLDRSLYSELDAIAREILVNVARHAHASEVCVSVFYRPRAVHILFSDNGVGIPAEVLGAGGRAGHFGLRGMHERASGIGGRLSVHSEPGRGTRLELVVPSSVAYPKRRGKHVP